jgi:tRNA(Ile)-lysidine synthase
LKRNEPGFSARALARVLRDHLSGSVAVKIAYSGGADSHVLLHALCELRDSSPWVVSAIHVNHGLHPQAGVWADHCLAVCQRYSLACAVEHLKVRAIGTEGLEAAARRLRYATLARHIGPGEALLTAHHLNDQAETVLLQLLRGAGVRGLAGMRAVVDFSNGKLVRPLLEFTRAELLTYAQQQELRWIEDTSNRDLGRSRNFIRHQVLPLLEQRWPQAKRVIARAARHAAEASALLDLVASTDLLSLPREQGGMVSIPGLRRLEPPRRRNAIRYWIRQHRFAMPPTHLFEQIVRLVEQSSRSRHAAITWPGGEVRRYREGLWIMPPRPNTDAEIDLTWNLAEPLKVPGTDYVLCLETAVGSGLSVQRASGKTAHVRLRRGGESLRLPGRRHHHKLKKLLQDAGVPPWERQRLPLIFIDDELVAVGDRWVCAAFAAQAGESSWRIVLKPAGWIPDPLAVV